MTPAVTDVKHLRGIALQAQEAWAVEPVHVVAERGYSHGEAIKACADAGIAPYVAKPCTSAHRTGGLYANEPFTSAPEHACSRGPAGQALTCRVATVELGRQIRS